VQREKIFIFLSFFSLSFFPDCFEILGGGVGQQPPRGHPFLASPVGWKWAPKRKPEGPPFSSKLPLAITATVNTWCNVWGQKTTTIQSTPTQRTSTKHKRGIIFFLFGGSQREDTVTCVQQCERSLFAAPLASSLASPLAPAASLLPLKLFLALGLVHHPRVLGLVLVPVRS